MTPIPHRNPKIWGDKDPAQIGSSRVCASGSRPEGLTSLASSLLALAVRNVKESSLSSNPFAFCFSQLLLYRVWGDLGEQWLSLSERVPLEQVALGLPNAVAL